NLAPKTGPFPSFFDCSPIANRFQPTKVTGSCSQIWGPFSKTSKATVLRPKGPFDSPAMSQFGAPALQLSSISPVSPVAGSSTSSAGGPAPPPPPSRGGGGGGAGAGAGSGPGG